MAHSHAKRYLTVYFALLILLAATVAASFVHLGAISLLVAVVIATAKTVLIMLFFMHLWDETPLVRVFAVSGFLWLTAMLVILLADYSERRPVTNTESVSQILRSTRESSGYGNSALVVHTVSSFATPKMALFVLPEHAAP